ncbi:MAG TPA: hypothetical protein VHX15_17505 [Frankiaceae bacterium]|nr:hypothetical protein [Frankiaceae bacterium]
MRRRAATAAATMCAGILAGGLALASPSAAAAPPAAKTPGIVLKGCSGNGTSKSSKGAAIQTATAPNPPSSEQRPLVVDPKGTLAYSGRSSSVIRHHTWRVKVDGITVKTGGSANASGKVVSQGTVNVKDYLPFKITGLFYVSGSITGSAAGCSGSFWVKVTGSPVGTVPWFLGIVLAIAGVGGLFLSRPSYTRLKVTA